MNRINRALIIGSLLIATPYGAENAKEVKRATESALRRTAEAVVLILSTVADSRLLRYSEVANGIIISKDGYILTVSHGLTGSIPEVYVGDDRYAAKVVYNDRTFDFAILKIETGYPLPYIQFASDTRLNQNVYLIGKRKRHRELFMSKGILNVKGINMSSKEISWIKTCIHEKKRVDYAVNNGILHSAHFFVGLSGCPLLNSDGELIGMNTGIIGREDQRITLALELVCFLPVIEMVTTSAKIGSEITPCGINVDLKNPLERVKWIMNGLFQYCVLLGKDTVGLELLRVKVEQEALKKISSDNIPPKEVINWAWKKFLTESYSLR